MNQERDKNSITEILLPSPEECGEFSWIPQYQENTEKIARSSRRIVLKSSIFIGALISGFSLALWLAGKYSKFQIDWGVVAPLIGAIGTSIPIFWGIYEWLEKKIEGLSDRVDGCEIGLQTHAHDEYEEELGVLRRVLYKVEARVETLRDERSNSQITEIAGLLAELKNKLEKIEHDQC